jgi:fatty acid desaturase
MLRGLIAGAVVGLINLTVSLVSGGDVASVLSTLVFFVVLGVLLDLFLGRRGALAVSIAGFAVMAGLLAVAYALAGAGGGADGVRVEIQGFEGPLGVAVALGSLAVYWVIFYAVYRIVERYVG